MGPMEKPPYVPTEIHVGTVTDKIGSLGILSTRRQKAAWMLRSTARQRRRSSTPLAQFGGSLHRTKASGLSRSTFCR